MNLQSAVLDSLFLFNQSENHRLYTLEEFNSYCIFPLLHNKALLDYEGGTPTTFVSWCLLKEDEVEDYLSEMWNPPEEVYTRNELTSNLQLWIMDMIAPRRGFMASRRLARHWHTVYGKGVKAHWRRLHQPDRVHSKEI